MKDFASDAFQAVLEHCQSETEFEVGGLLVGLFTPDGIEIRASIPALKAAAGTANVTFTHEVWESALKTIETKFPEWRIVGWYHTHPRFGVFMSNYDQFIQEKFFPDARMQGVVIDPIAGQGGLFQFIDGKVTQTNSFSVEQMDDERSGSINTAIRQRKRRSGFVLLVPTVAVVGVLVGFFLGGAGSNSKQSVAPTPVTTTTAVPATAARCEVSITIRYGATYWDLAGTLLGDSQRYPELQAQTRDASLLPGEVLKFTSPVCSMSR